MKKLNNVLVKSLKDYILDGENKEEIVHELKRYKTHFPFEPDYNWYRYGNILPYYSQIRKFYEDNKAVCPASNEALEKHFFAHLKKAIDEIILENPDIK